jgi:hypothetical protein
MLPADAPPVLFMDAPPAVEFDAPPPVEFPCAEASVTKLIAKKDATITAATTITDSAVSRLLNIKGFGGVWHLKISKIFSNKIFEYKYL